MSKRLTIKQQEAIAAKSRKMPEPSQELPSQEQQPAAEIESDNQIRDRQVNVKFTTDDLSRLKKAAAENHRPVANYIYHLTMDKITQDGY
jgi:predicted DNA binding CopG/RHH family protein